MGVSKRFAKFFWIWIINYNFAKWSFFLINYFFFTISTFSLFLFNSSIWILSNLCENDLGSRSKVFVSPIKLNSLSYNITLSKFWKRNLVENKNFLISSSVKLILSLFIWSIVLFIICIWFEVFLLIKLGWIAFK